MSRRSQAGFTLIELIVAATVFGILSLAFGNFLVGSMTNYQYLQAQSNAAADITNLIGRVSRVVRGSTDVVDAQANTLTVYAYFSPQDAIVKKVRYFVSGTTLNVGVTPPTGTAPNYTYDSANETVTVIAKDLVMGSTPVFTYYDDNGTTLSATPNLSDIRQIGVAVIMNPDVKRLKTPLSNQTIVSLRNKKTNL